MAASLELWAGWVVLGVMGHHPPVRWTGSWVASTGRASSSSPSRVTRWCNGRAFEYSVGSVWFVHAIGNRTNLWHAQTIRFLRNV